MINQAKQYGWKGRDEPYSSSYLQETLNSVLDNQGYERLVDVGTGNGYNLKFLSQFCGTLVGYEPDKEGVEIARAENPDTPIRQLGVYDEPDPDDLGIFDCVVSMEVLEHLFDPHALPVFAGKLLKPGGRLILSTPYHGYWKNLALALRGKWDFHHHPLRVGGHIKFFSYATMKALLITNGFEVDRLMGSGRFAPFWCSMVAVATKR